MREIKFRAWQPHSSLHRQATADVLCAKLEVLKRPLEECGRCNACETAMTCTTAEADILANQALTLAQDIIRATLSKKNV